MTLRSAKPADRRSGLRWITRSRILARIWRTSLPREPPHRAATGAVSGRGDEMYPGRACLRFETRTEKLATNSTNLYEILSLAHPLQTETVLYLPSGEDETWTLAANLVIAEILAFPAKFLANLCVLRVLAVNFPVQSYREGAKGPSGNKVCILARAPGGQMQGAATQAMW